MKLTNISLFHYFHLSIFIHLFLFNLATIFFVDSRFSSDFSRQTFKKLKSDDNSNTFYNKQSVETNSIDDLSNILSNLRNYRTSPTEMDLLSIKSLASLKINKIYQKNTLEINSTEICSETPEYRKIEWLKSINVSSFSFQAKKQQVKYVKISKKQARRTKQWLASKLSCKTDFRWKDMGEFVYPRYLKFGQCGGNNSISCSLPPGMFCKPDKFKGLTMYVFAPSTKRSCRYKRQSRKSTEVVRQGRKKKNLFRCRPRWLAMDYQIVESCSCQC